MTAPGALDLLPGEDLRSFTEDHNADFFFINVECDSWETSLNCTNSWKPTFGRPRLCNSTGDSPHDTELAAGQPGREQSEPGANC
jgi:hypothetical protein